MTDYYALFGSFEPRLWDLIIDVLLYDVCTDVDMFQQYFYPVLETFPGMCESTINRTYYYLRVHGPTDRFSPHYPFDSYNTAKDLIRDDAQKFKIAMAKRLAVRANQFQLPELKPHHHPPQDQKRPRIPSPQTTGNKHSKY